MSGTIAGTSGPFAQPDSSTARIKRRCFTGCMIDWCRVAAGIPEGGVEATVLPRRLPGYGPRGLGPSLIDPAEQRVLGRAARSGVAVIDEADDRDRVP